MAIAEGYIGGMVNNKLLTIGKRKLINKALGIVKHKPANITGKCIGNNIEPNCGICPVTKGNINPSNKNIPDNVISFVFIFPP